MKDDVMDMYIEAGRIASEIREKGAGEIRVGASYLWVVEKIEGWVQDAGAGLAFPLNVSLNEDAAHDTASRDDERVFSDGDVVKLDLGVHLDGYIADTAVTVDLGDHPLLLEASARGLDAAISIVAPGVSVGELGSAIHGEIESRGFRPIANLTGHGLDRYRIHTPPEHSKHPPERGSGPRGGDGLCHRTLRQYRDRPCLRETPHRDFPATRSKAGEAAIRPQGA